MTAGATPVRPLEVHAWLDVACPWCWIAKRRFEEAAAEFGGPVTVEYHSFELAPDLSADYLSTEVEFLQRLYSISANDATMRIRLVTSTGARLGLAHDFDRVQHTSTCLAHQLLHHGKVEGRQQPLLDALFSAFFEQGRDLRHVDELVAIAQDVGLAAEDTREVLERGQYAEAVRADRRLAADHGVTNIPTYVLPGQPPIHGAKRPAALVESLRKAAGLP